MHAPGWYPDPQGSDQLRWWDGQQWTAQLRPPLPTPGSLPGGPTQGPWTVPGAPAAAALTPTSTTPEPSTKRTTTLLLVVGAVVVLGVGALVAVLLLRNNEPSITATVSQPTPTTGTPTTRERVGDAGDTDDTVEGDDGDDTTTTRRRAQPTELEVAAEEAGIPVLDAEGSATHTHSLFVIEADGEETIVPANIGIDQEHRQIAAVHTHNDSGVIHIESPTKNDSYTIGQFLILSGLTDDQAICDALAEGPCSIEFEVIAPTAAHLDAFDRSGPMPDEPPISAAGKDTELVQGAVILMRVTTEP